MLMLYLAALGLGGTFLLASLFMGGHDADADADADMEMDADADVHAEVDAQADADGDADGHGDADDHAGAIDGVMAWLPVTSLRFWTFFLAFFGLTGTVLTLFGLGFGPVVIAAIAGVIGYGSGWAVVASIRHLSRTESNSAVSERDYVGATGRVMVPVAKDKVGKVRIEIKGRTVEMLARTEDDIEFASQQPVIIYAVADDHVLVTRAE
jgi:membrane protein implicated in regulation of membrane protease activity